jgi:hypothetical protein
MCSTGLIPSCRCCPAVAVDPITLPAPLVHLSGAKLTACTALPTVCGRKSECELCRTQWPCSEATHPVSLVQMCACVLFNDVLLLSKQLVARVMPKGPAGSRNRQGALSLCVCVCVCVCVPPPLSACVEATLPSRWRCCPAALCSVCITCLIPSGDKTTVGAACPHRLLCCTYAPGVRITCARLGVVLLCGRPCCQPAVLCVSKSADE